LCAVEFETGERRRLEEELKAYNHELEEEMAKEKQRHERNLEALNKRKEDMINDRKKKFEVCDGRAAVSGESQISDKWQYCFNYSTFLAR